MTKPMAKFYKMAKFSEKINFYVPFDKHRFDKIKHFYHLGHFAAFVFKVFDLLSRENMYGPIFVKTAFDFQNHATKFK